MPDKILTIRMQPNDVGCDLCGATTDFLWGVPTYNGDVVSNDFVPPSERHTGSVPVCERCYRSHEAGRMPTFDHYYVAQQAPEGR